MDVIMAALYLESDTGDDVPQPVRDLRHSSSQLTIHVYPEVRDPMNPWAYKEEMLLADVIAANVSRAEKKKKCRIVCRTHEVGSAHHTRSDGVPVSVPTVVPQGLAILLADAATQTEPDEATFDNLEHEIKNLEAPLEAEANMKKATEEKNAKLSQELENMLALFSDLQVSNDHLSQQVATLQEQVSGEKKLKAAFEEFKQYEDNRVEQRCAEMDARLDALSIDFDEELYPHMLTAIAGRRWMIGRGLRLVVMKCGESLELRQAFADVVSARIVKGMSEGLRHGVKHGQAQLSLESIEAYDQAEAKYIAALQALKDLKYPLVDQLEGLTDAPMDVIMVALYLESDTGDDVPQPMLLADAIAANVSRAEKKKKCRIVCRTHGVGSAHHARSDGVPVSVPTVVPQGLAILLADAATQMEPDEATFDNL
nr:hypothetical protein [Tanacetum cinerariifolium]